MTLTTNIAPCAALPGTTTLTVAPDTAPGYALVTLDGDLAGTYSLAVVPEAGWDDTPVTQAVLGWYGATEAAK